MRIQNKLFAIFFLSSTFLVVSLVLFIQWTMGKGMVEYVNAREVRELQPLADDLAQIYQREQSWDSLMAAHRRFKTLIEKHLQGSEFQIPGTGSVPSGKDRRGPPPRRNEDQPREVLRDGRPPPIGSEPQDNRPPPPHGFGRRPEASYALLDENKQYVIGRYLPELSYRYMDVVAAELTAVEF